VCNNNSNWAWVGRSVNRGGQELTVPWAAVGHIRVGGDFRWPWVVAYLDPTFGPDQVPAARGRDGAYKLFPVGHGLSAKKRGMKLRELRAAIMGASRRYLDEI
jgi:eukaryotic-like serine/threonine-protein kinase